MMIEAQNAQSTKILQELETVLENYRQELGLSLERRLKHKVKILKKDLILNKVLNELALELRLIKEFKNIKQTLYNSEKSHLMSLISEMNHQVIEAAKELSSLKTLQYDRLN